MHSDSDRRFFRFCFIVILCIAHSTLQCQSFPEEDSVHTISLVALFGTGDQTAFWLHAKNSQRYDRDPNQGIVSIFSSSTILDKNNFQVNYKAELVGRLSSEFSGNLIQGGLGMSYKNFSLFGGRQEEVWGIRDTLLNIASNFNANNSLPIPKVSLQSGWIPIPIWNESISLRFYVAHGWLEENRRVSKPFLHQKSLHFRVGKDIKQIRVFIGITHNALWGGTLVEDDLKLSSSFSDFLRVTLAQNDVKNANQGEFNNSIGDHFGELDFGVTRHFKTVQVMGYMQIPFEDASGLQPRYINTGLAGLSIQFQKSRFLKRINLEMWSTKEQDEDKLTSQGTFIFAPENYYNNFLYSSGWTYHGEPVGNAMFTRNEQQTFHFTAIRNIISGFNLSTRWLLGNVPIIARYVYFENLGNAYTVEDFGFDKQYLHSVECSAKIKIKRGTFAPVLIYQHSNFFANGLYSNIQFSWKI